MSDAGWAETFGGDVGDFAEGLVGILDDFEEHWKEAQSNEIGDTEEKKKELRGIATWAEECAKYVLDASTALAVPTHPYDRIPDWSKEICELFETDSIAIRFMREGIYSAQPAARRTIRLFPLVIEAKTNDAVRKFLKRIARCYIWDFAPECIILCRSALEAALGEGLMQTAIRKDPNWERAHIKDNINRAHCLGLLDEEGKKYAHEVRIRGNKTLHDQPDITNDIFGTIKMTTVVLAQIYRT